MTKIILIVDDSKTVRKALKGFVEDMGFEVEEAADGQEALDYCKKTIPTCILLDWNMPVMSGIDFLKVFRANPSSKATKIIFCSTENDLNHMKEAILSGADEYIIKPFDKTIISDKLKKVGII